MVVTGGTWAPGRVGLLDRWVTRLRLRGLLATVRAALVLVLVEAAIRWMPLPRLARLCGVRFDLAPAGDVGEVLRSRELPSVARRRLRAARRVSHIWPFCEGPCLRSALVGGHLIRDLGPTLRIGVAPDGDSIRAHAWLEIAGRPLEDVSGLRSFGAPVTDAPAIPTPAERSES